MPAAPTYQACLLPNHEIDRAAVMRLAAHKARHERESCRRIGWERSWSDVMGKALKLVWDYAKSAQVTRRERDEIAKLPAHEQVALQFDLKAELAEYDIPPRKDDARLHRARAAEIRSAGIEAVAS